MKINVQFDGNWFYSESSHMLAVTKLISLVTREIEGDVKVLEKSLNSCTLELPDSLSEQEADARIRALLRENICADSGQKEPYTLQITGSGTAAPEPGSGVGAAAPEVSAEPMRKEFSKDGAAQQPQPQPQEKTADDVLEAVEDLVGSEDFKALCRDIHRRAPQVLANDTREVFLSGAYLFTGNEGHGCALAQKLLAELLKLEDIFHPTSDPYTMKLWVDPEKIFNGSIPAAISGPRVLTVDLSNAEGKTRAPEFKQLLLEIFRRGRGDLVIFRAPFMSPEKADMLSQDLRDVLTVKTLCFPLFTEKQLRELAERELRRHGFSAAEDVWPLFQKKIDQECRDGYFYGVQTVRKIANELIQAQESLPSENAKEITAQAAQSIVAPAAADSVGGLDSLDRMVGMEAVARQVREMINMVLVARADGQRGVPMHMCFTGNPGTGKTTVARIVGKALRDAGILRIGDFVEHHARDLCGAYVGHTAMITNRICQEAYGSVLFLDEAYSLVSDPESRDFGHEAMDTLIAQMENHRDDLVVIVAGYPAEMDRFLRSNPGMRTRIPYLINFPNYSREELYRIFEGMATARFRCGEGLLEHAKDYFLGLSDEVLNDRTFGNGRFVRNLYERTWSKAAMRCSGTPAADLVLETVDFDAAAAEMPESAGKSAKTVRRIGF